MGRMGVGLALSACALAPLPALAWHTEETPVTDYSAATLNNNEWRLGIFRFEYGLLDSLQLSTFPIFWALKITNGVVKWRAYETGNHSFSAELGFFQLKLEDFIDEADREPGTEYPVIRAVPFTVVATTRQGDFSFNGGLAFTLVSFSGEVQDSDLEGVGGASTIMFKPAIEWRLGETLALVLEGRVKLVERYSANVVTTYTIDEDSELEVHGQGGLEIDGFKGNIALSAFWSWKHLNVRAGLGYGYYAVPVVNVFVPVVTYFPEFDLYWRF